MPANKPYGCVKDCAKKFESSRKQALTKHQLTCSAHIAYQQSATQSRLVRASANRAQRGGQRMNKTLSRSASSSLMDIVSPSADTPNSEHDQDAMLIDEVIQVPTTLAPMPQVPVPTSGSRDLPVDSEPAAIPPQPRLSDNAASGNGIVQNNSNNPKLFNTDLDRFGLWRSYSYQPSYDPTTSNTPRQPLRTHLSESESRETRESLSIRSLPVPQNESIAMLLDWQNDGTSLKSDGALDKLVHSVLLDPRFSLADLKGFSSQKEKKRLHKEAAKNPLLDEFKEATVNIKVPSGDKAIPARDFPIHGLHCRNLNAVIRAAFSGPLAPQFHLHPFKLFHQTSDGQNKRMFSEAYDSDVFLQAHDEVQKLSLHPSDADCTRERIVAGLMCWSDMTHLADFGTAKLWPVYLMLGNLSKHVREDPKSGACMHLAYLPQLSDAFYDSVSQFHQKWSTQKKDIKTHCKRELVHAAWAYLLDDEFLHAYKYGMVIKCPDGVERRVFPRFLTYGADYPEKVLLATIRDKGDCPCPRCLVPKGNTSLMGQVKDLSFRIKNARSYLGDKVNLAHSWIYKDADPIHGAAVERLLKETSSVPTKNAFVTRLGEDFKIYRMLVVDLLHEFELGVWKAIFTHLIRILYAAGDHDSLVNDLDNRYRQTPTFGSRGTIRKFANSVSQMKKLAGRDFEDLLQCAIPAFEGLLDEPHNTRLMKLLFRTAEWHSFAKLQLHTETTLDHFNRLTVEFGRLLREFCRLSCSAFSTQELPQEVEKRKRRRTEAQAETSSSNPRTAKERKLNLSTYKFHALGDYSQAIMDFGGTDSYSTQIGEVAHRTVKRLYGLTNKKSVARDIGRRVRREEQSWASGNLSANTEEERLEKPYYNERYYLSESRNQPFDLLEMLRKHKGDPAYQNFVPLLREHLLGRMLGRKCDGDTYGAFSAQEQNSLHIINNRIYAVNTLRINYTTYDIRRDYDLVNPRTHPHVFIEAPDSSREKETWPYWYARVLGIFHLEAWTSHPECRSSVPQTIKLLWVRWLGKERGYRWGYPKAPHRLPKIGFIPTTDEGAFGFLDPALVVRGCHLIPAYHEGRTDTLLPTPSNAARSNTRDCDSPADDCDWVNYYVNIFVDRDMMMRYFGGGVGHHTSESLFKEARKFDENELFSTEDPEPDDLVGSNLDMDDSDSGSDSESNHGGVSDGEDSSSDEGSHSGYATP